VGCLLYFALCVVCTIFGVWFYKVFFHQKRRKEEVRAYLFGIAEIKQGEKLERGEWPVEGGRPLNRERRRRAATIRTQNNKNVNKK
jgi:hypothetical protein